MRHIAVRLKRGRKLHAVSEGSETPRITFCGRPADGAIVSAEIANCVRCLQEMARGN